MVLEQAHFDYVLIFTVWSIDPCLSWIEDKLLLYLFYLMALTLHTGKYIWELSCSRCMRKCDKLWRLAGLSQRKRRLIGIMQRSKWQTSTIEHWTPYLVQSRMRSLRKYPQLKLQRKHGPFSKRPMKELRPLKIPSFKGLLQTLRRSRWRRMI